MRTVKTNMAAPALLFAFRATAVVEVMHAPLTQSCSVFTVQTSSCCVAGAQRRNVSKHLLRRPVASSADCSVLSFLKQYSGKSVLEQESEPAKPSVNLEEIKAEIKAKIEEEAYNKGYQEGLKQSKVLLEEKSEDENDAEKLLELKHKDEESGKRYKSSRRISEVLALLNQFCPKISVTRRLLWIFLMLFVVMCVVISIFTFFSDYYNRREDT